MYGAGLWPRRANELPAVPDHEVIHRIEQARISTEHQIVPVGWAPPARDAQEYVRFFRQYTDESFISFGEITDGRADAPDRRAPKLEQVLTEEIADALSEQKSPDEYMRIFDARDAQDRLVAYALVSWDKSARRPNAWLQDVIVESGMRGKGLGAHMVEAIEAEIREDSEIREIFLESSVQ